MAIYELFIKWQTIEYNKKTQTYKIAEDVATKWDRKPETLSQTAKAIYEQESKRQLYNLKPWKKIIIKAAGCAINIASAIICFILAFTILGTTENTYIIGLDENNNQTSFEELYKSNHVALPPAEAINTGIEMTISSNPISSAIYYGGQENSLTIEEAEKHSLATYIISMHSKEEPPSIQTLNTLKEEIKSSGANKITYKYKIPQSRPRALLALFGVLSLLIGILNLIPFLPYDGGHIIFVLAETFRRKEASANTYLISTTLGIIITIALVAIPLFL